MITELERDIAGYVREYAAGSAHGLADALSEVLQPRTFAGLLEGIAVDEARFAAVLGRSVWHPNGFAKIVLLVGEQFRLRLHTWEGGEAVGDAPQENIHNHRWDFTAAILAGGYRHQEFQPRASGAPFLGYRYQPSADRSSYALVPLGPRTLDCVFEADLTRGSRYLMSRTLYHRVVPRQGAGTVSLVLEGPHQPTPVEVFAEPGVTLPEEAPLPRLSPQLLVRQLRAAAELLLP
ncbi:hypothetical protein [Kitasatospora azatica]|uniref:hypothetical protein n=1 Tax=Kitasatospora azatica TaxID=58347 RepID=UPI00068C3D27|nr:hypothetical protein [Kitasatospora azatica]